MLKLKYIISAWRATPIFWTVSPLPDGAVAVTAPAVVLTNISAPTVKVSKAEGKQGLIYGFKTGYIKQAERESRRIAETVREKNYDFYVQCYLCN